jgi:hypothetical protein
MDDAMQSRMDSVVEEEIRRGYRVLDVPAELVQQLETERAINPAVTVFKKIRFLKVTPRRRSDIARAVVLRYHTDLQDKTLLSNEQLRALNVARGEWSADEDKKLEDLQERSNALMRQLTLTGFDPREEWMHAMNEATSKLLADLDNPDTSDNRKPLGDADRALAHRFLNRWMEFRKENQARFDELYAAEQGLSAYSPDKDFMWLMDHSPTLDSVDLLQAVDELRDKLDKYLTLLEVREQLFTIQSKRAKIFAESVESRRDQAEEMGRVYFCAELLDADEKGCGRVAKTFEQMWELPDDVIQWLLIEAYFFFSNVPVETREFLERWGFVRAPGRSGSSASPVESPAEPSSKHDSPPSAVTPPVSSGSSPDTK